MAGVLLGIQERRTPAPLAKIGGKLAVLGVDLRGGKHWHIAKPGTWDAPQGSGMAMISYATSLCGITIATNGYAADFRPAVNVQCPGCEARL
jgi:hypothetical protein